MTCNIQYINMSFLVSDDTIPTWPPRLVRRLLKRSKSEAPTKSPQRSLFFQCIDISLYTTTSIFHATYDTYNRTFDFRITYYIVIKCLSLILRTRYYLFIQTTWITISLVRVKLSYQVTIVTNWQFWDAMLH